MPHTPKAALYTDPIPGIIPYGTTTLLAGPSQLGKTAMIASWAVRFRDGKSICRHPTQAPTGGIGVLVVDRRKASHIEWFRRAGWESIPMYSYRDDPKTNWEDFLQRPKLKGLLLHGLLELEKQGVGRGGLVIIDPISPFIAGNLIDYKHTLAGLGVIDQLCGERGVTLLGIAHMGKQKSEKERYTRPQDRILGSAALGGFTDTQIYMLGPDDTDHGNYELGWIPHNAPAEAFQFERDELGLFSLAKPSTAEQDAITGILGTLQGLGTDDTGDPRECRTKDLLAGVVENYGASVRTIERGLQHLLLTAQIKRKGRGSYALVGNSKPANE